MEPPQAARCCRSESFRTRASGTETLCSERRGTPKGSAPTSIPAVPETRCHSFRYSTFDGACDTLHNPCILVGVGGAGDAVFEMRCHRVPLLWWWWRRKLSCYRGCTADSVCFSCADDVAVVVPENTLPSLFDRLHSHRDAGCSRLALVLLVVLGVLHQNHLDSMKTDEPSGGVSLKQQQQ